MTHEAPFVHPFVHSCTECRHRQISGAGFPEVISDEGLVVQWNPDFYYIKKHPS